MVNEQLLEYIRLRQAAGASKEDITNALTTGGWAPGDVAEGFSRISGTPLSSVNVSTASPARKGRVWLIVGGVVLVLLLAGAGAVYAIPSLRTFLPGMVERSPVTPIAEPTPTPTATSTLEVATSTPVVATSTLMATSTPGVTATSTATTSAIKK